jgi:hypothetical protein
MSRGIAVHVVAGILFVGVGTSDAQESIPRPAVVEARVEPGVLFRLDYVAGIEGHVGVTVGIPNIHADDPNENIEGRQNSDRSPQDASDSPQAKAGLTRRWFAGATRRMLEFVLSVCWAVRAGDEARH